MYWSLTRSVVNLICLCKRTVITNYRYRNEKHGSFPIHPDTIISSNQRKWRIYYPTWRFNYVLYVFHRQTTLHPLPARYRKARQSFLPFLRSLVLNPHPQAPWPWAPPQAPPLAIPATCHPTGGIHLAIFSTHISLVPQSTITCPKHHLGSQVIRALL